MALAGCGLSSRSWGCVRKDRLFVDEVGRAILGVCLTQLPQWVKNKSSSTLQVDGKT